MQFMFLHGKPKLMRISLFIEDYAGVDIMEIN